MIENRRFYTYRQAAVRVKRSPQTIRKWRAGGMPMTWNSSGERVVSHEILMAEFRRRCEADFRNHTPAREAARAAFEADPLAWFEADDDLDESDAREAAEADMHTLTEGATAAPSSGVTSASQANFPATETFRVVEAPEQSFTALMARLRERSLGPSPMRAAPASAWKRLQVALATTLPECAEDGRFTLDKLFPGEAEHLATICARCPLRVLCADYAAEAKPAGGFWPTPENMSATTESLQQPATAA